MGAASGGPLPCLSTLIGPGDSAKHFACQLHSCLHLHSTSPCSRSHIPLIDTAFFYPCPPLLAPGTLPQPQQDEHPCSRCHYNPSWSLSILESQLLCDRERILFKRTASRRAQVEGGRHYKEFWWSLHDSLQSGDIGIGNQLRCISLAPLALPARSNDFYRLNNFTQGVHSFSPGAAGWLISFWPRMTAELASSAPRVMRSSVQMAGSTRDPSGMRATRLNRNIAASNERKNSRAPAKKKLPAHACTPGQNAWRSKALLHAPLQGWVEPILTGK